MKRTTFLLALGLTAFASEGAIAGDFNNGAGGLKDAGGLAGVPVPAPVPVMESFSWYTRADFGYAVKSSGNSVVWHAFDGSTDSLSYDRNEGPFLGTIGFGRYITPKLRWDATIDFRGSQKAQSGLNYRQGTTTKLGPVVDVNGTQVQSYDTNYFDIWRAEEVRFQNHTGLINLYYDFNRGSGFNPYVGVGAGLAVRVSEVSFRETGECAFSINDVTGFHPCVEPGYDKSGRPTNVNYGLAAAAMAGFTYEVRPGLLLDTGYRLSWQGGQNTVTLFGGDKVTGEARTDHEIRAGMRWNVW